MNSSRDFCLNQQPSGVIRSRCQSKSKVMLPGGRMQCLSFNNNNKNNDNDNDSDSDKDHQE